MPVYSHLAVEHDLFSKVWLSGCPKRLLYTAPRKKPAKTTWSVSRNKCALNWLNFQSRSVRYSIHGLTDGCMLDVYASSWSYGHTQPPIEQAKPRVSPETQEGDDERVLTTPLQADLPGLYIENGRVDAVLLKSSSSPP